MKITEDELNKTFALNFGRKKELNNEIEDLKQKMGKCNCTKFQGGRGSGIGYVHNPTKRIVQFDGPHPGNELYKYQIEKIKKFIDEIGEKEAD